MTVNCVVCDGAISVPDNAMVGELLTCGDCGTELELVSLNPMIVEEAPEIQEDWGE